MLAVCTSKHLFGDALSLTSAIITFVPGDQLSPLSCVLQVTLVAIFGLFVILPYLSM